MIRKIIQINEDLCNGCGACAEACHEGAIAMRGGKAVLTRDDYCDGLGDCLPACPTGAITFVEREAAPYNHEAVMSGRSGCPGSSAKSIGRAGADIGREPESEPQSRLLQWPVQIKLAPVCAPFYNGAKLLVAADCSAYAFAGFHEKFMRGHITLIGCPKLDGADYSEKLAAIIAQNDIKSVAVARMEVPCCGGLENAVKTALQASGKFLPWQVVTISTDGKIIS